MHKKLCLGLLLTCVSTAHAFFGFGDDKPKEKEAPKVAAKAPDAKEPAAAPAAPAPVTPAPALKTPAATVAPATTDPAVTAPAPVEPKTETAVVPAVIPKAPEVVPPAVAPKAPSAAKLADPKVITKIPAQAQTPTLEGAVKAPVSPLPKALEKPAAIETVTASTPAAQNTPCNFNASSGFADVVKTALPAVVNVATMQIVDAPDRSDGPEMPGMQGSPFQGTPFDDLFKKFFEQQERPRRVQSLGSGFIVKVDKTFAYIVTNYHVVSDAKKISIFLHDKTEVEAKLHGSDERTDIAVLKIDLSQLPESKRNLASVSWEEDSQSRVGDWVIAIGNPFGLGSSVTVGIVSCLGRDIIAPGRGGRLNSYVDDYIQHSAQINFGNSGGCLLNTKGNVIGINSAILSPSGGNVGVGFAIPSGVSKATVEQLIEFRRTRRGWLGVKIQNLTKEMSESLGVKGGGAIVSSVTKDGPADKAKIEPHDIFIEYNGKRITEDSRLSRLVGETKVGSDVKVKVLRKGKEIQTVVKVGEYESSQATSSAEAATDVANQTGQSSEVAGIAVATLTQAMRQRLNPNMSKVKGLLVLRVDPASSATETGLLRGDVIREVNQQELNTPQDFAAKIEAAKKANKKSVLLLVYRDGEPRYVLLKFDDEASDGVTGPSGKGAVEHPANKPKAVL